MPYDEHRTSILSDGTIPHFQGEMPVKSMDVSEIGFRERYQSALTTKTTRVRNTHDNTKSLHGNILVRNSEIVTHARNNVNQFDQPPKL